MLLVGWLVGWLVFVRPLLRFGLVLCRAVGRRTTLYD